MHSEMAIDGRGHIMVGGEWNERVRSPQPVGGMNTQSLHVELEKDIDAHCERARAAGAVIVQEPEDQFYGARTYRALDLEGASTLGTQTGAVMTGGVYADSKARSL